MSKTNNKTAAPGATRKAASKINEPKFITSSSRRPPPKDRLAACMASNFWRPIVQTRLKRDRAGQSGSGDSIESAMAEARPSEGVSHG